MVRLAKVIRAFFPVNLLFAHLRYNLVMLFYWLIIFAIVNRGLGAKFGLPYLFLSPEYFGHSGFLSFFLLGVGLGGFIVAFNIYSYVQLGSRYPFIATLSRPFTKFVLNNSIIPIAFLINYSYCIIVFQKAQESVGAFDNALQISALFIGVILFIVLSILYFLPTNKDLFKITGKKSEEFRRQTSNISTTLHKHQTWYKEFLRKNVHHYYYFGKHLRLKRSRSTNHYDIELLNQVFTQNNINASVFEILTILAFIGMGFFRDFRFFQVPTGMSIFLLFTIIIMIVSALVSWFKSWTYAFIILSFIGINYLSKNTNSIFQFTSYAFGLSYKDTAITPYRRSYFAQFKYPDSVLNQDYSNYIKTLNNWRKKTGEKKPKLVIVNSSGGGSRSATWSFKVLQAMDSIMKGQFSTHIQMITGASGGMVGAAYYRDLMLEQQQGKVNQLYQKKYFNNISDDLLNRLALALITNDLFFSFQSVNINGHSYSKDRGYAFEQELKSNLKGAFNHTLGYYTKYERLGAIPTMIFSPTIVNDGRRLLICSQPVSFLSSLDDFGNQKGVNAQFENVGYLHYFKKNEPEKIQFSTVLRMNASFPYIMPMVTMPTEPQMLVMDAGIRDNYGAKTTVRYLVALHDWIKKNTSGVIIVQIRDTKKSLIGEKYINHGFLGRLLLPIGNVYGNFPRVQDFNQDELLSAFLQSIDYPVNIVTFNLREHYNDKISLSWHLTKKEKQKINKAFYSADNKKATKELLNLLKKDK